MSGELRAPSIPSLTQFRPAALRPLDYAGARAPHRTNPAARPRVVEADVFKGVLFRERKRADRSNQPFVLLLVSAHDRAGADSRTQWNAVIDALAAVRRETDVLGWFRPQSAAAVILTEVQAVDAPVARQIHARVQRELAKRLSAEARSRFSIRLHVYPEPKNAAEDELLAVDPILRELRPMKKPSPVRDAAKRALDVVGSLLLLAAFSPLLLLIAALVKLTSPGPIFFRQLRVGQHAKPFAMLKFRTMGVNFDHALHQEFVTSFIKPGLQAQESGQPGVFKITNDPRVTRLGRVLRRTSLDELPQFWNVLRGEMSLVGPRPPIPYEVEQYASWHRRRVLEAKPGITGLWQVAGRSRTTFDEMVRLDLQYARNCSLWTDVKILLATPKAVIAGKGAC
jgi:exopolysaccharide biosynthesis polyprenyl glycosylphosphotransferase